MWTRLPEPPESPVPAVLDAGVGQPPLHLRAAELGVATASGKTTDVDDRPNGRVAHKVHEGLGRERAVAYRDDRQQPD
jgi:hypothetical protein